MPQSCQAWSAFTPSAVGANVLFKGIDKPAKVVRSRGVTGLRPQKLSQAQKDRDVPTTGTVGRQLRVCSIRSDDCSEGGHGRSFPSILRRRTTFKAQDRIAETDNAY